ncbi:hypothetical protein ACJIZ3_006722 [Penstemon smallii]|uniref:PUM-HD domain-containing protein n=1 Tax=Penstemon smallii TaxID=265156 RepID=A0ABD3S8K6_9LAMI
MINTLNQWLDTLDNHRSNETNNNNRTEELLSAFSGSILLLMVDERMESLFQKLIEGCNYQQLNSIVGEVFSQSELLIRIAFCRQGSISIVKLIKRIKKTEHAFALTRILSTKFYAMVTHQTARIVIQQCFNLLGNRPNEVLYESTIYFFGCMATHEVGCISLNECIDTISGIQRLRLLFYIANIADYLSNDPYGNYVVQHVLDLKDDYINSRIYLCLKGQFIPLAQKKGGSHVVEKCLKSSILGLCSVVLEILSDPSLPFLLARDQFGNYVIQRALEECKERGFMVIYVYLVKALEPYYEELSYSVGGRHVINLLKDEFTLQRQSSINGQMRNV